MPVVSSQDMWTVERVKEELRQSAGSDGASAQVFFSEQISADSLGDAACAAIEHASHRLNGAKEVVIGRINRLAKSVAVKGDAETIAELMKENGVKAVLPSVIRDVYPKPVSSKRVD